ncbi:MAG: Mur ligase family protein [Candidatus Nanosyncoccaceae bacterium]
MIKKLISRYHPRYVRSLIYMLQASEYKISEYLPWLKRVRDFRSVEKRKQLDRTLKAILLLVLGWVLWLTLIALGIWLAVSQLSALRLLGLVVILLSPFILSYGIILPLLAVQLIQKPIEISIINQSRQSLSEHKALKIAIAGSFGKTSMREILKTVLSEGKKVAAPPHSYNTPLGISAFVKTLKGDEEIIVFELGEYYPGDVKKLCEIVNPDMGVITGVNDAHLEKFKTLDATMQTIFELADFLGDKPVYVNGESELAKKAAQDGHIIYDQSGVGEWKVQKPHSDLSGTSFVLKKAKKAIKLKSQLLGLHQVGPLAVAAAIAESLGLTTKQIEQGVVKTKPFDHRLELKTDESGVVILDDSYNGNPDGVRAVITFLASLKGRRFYVTPGLVEMGKNTEKVHIEIGRQLAKAKIEKVVLIRNSVTGYIERGLKDSDYRGDVIWFDDALDAFNALPQMTVKGDIILIQNDWTDQYA